jgi:DNA-binding GntR family transcriptional regulator
VASALSSDQILQIMETRLLLEPKLAFEAATANTPALLSRLSVTLDEMQSAQSLNRDDSHFVQCWLADEHFHELIAAAAGKPYMERAYLSLGGQVQRFRILARSGCRQAQAAVEEHRAIFQELQSGDSNGAYVAMKHHLTQASARAVEDARAIEGAAALIGESGVA